MEIKKLKDLCIGKGEYGIAAPAEPFSESKYRYLRITDISDNGTLLSDDPKSVSCPGCEKCILQENDIVFARTGNSTGRAFFYEPKYGELVYAGFLIKFHLDDTKVTPKYMKYYTISQTYRNWVNNGPTGSTRGNMSEGDFADMPVFLPSRKQQDAIVNLFSPFDEKIDNNNAIAAELEGMAKDLYDYWFVQFDFPDENGKPYKSSGGKMVWNEELKREIPEGWEVDRLGKVCDTLLGGTPDTENALYWNGDIPWLNSGEVATSPVLNAEKTITKEGLKNSATSFASAGAVVMSITRYIRPSILGIDACFNQSVIAVIPNEQIHSTYLYMFMLSQVERYMRLRTGAQQPHINKETVDSTLITLPVDSVLNQFYDRVEPLFERQMIAMKEAKELESLRDFLLPILMNGQVKVKGA